MPPARTVALLFVLYVCQGMPYGFQATALPIYLAVAGYSPTAIGFLGVLSLPWAAKALWAPLVDRYGSPRFGRRKSWIVPLQLGLALACGAAAFVPAREALGVLLALVLLMNLFAATQDVAVDGLAVDLLGRRQLGAGNAAQVIGYRVGMLVSGGLLVAATDTIGWSGLFLSMGALVALAAGFVLVHRETPTPQAETTTAPPAARLRLRDIVATLLAAIRLPGGVSLLVLIGTYKIGESMSDAMWKLYLLRAGWSAPTVGLWMGTYGIIAAVAGSLAGGVLATRAPLPRALALAAFLRVVPVTAQWLVSLGAPSAAVVLGVSLAEHVFGGALTVVMFAFMMSRVDRRIGATHFTLLASVEILGKSPGTWASGFIVESTGFSTLFAIGALLSGAYAVLVLLLQPTQRAPSAIPS